MIDYEFMLLLLFIFLKKYEYIDVLIGKKNLATILFNRGDQPTSYTTHF